MIASGNILIPNATIIAEFIAFVVILGFLAKWVVPYVAKLMADREDAIRSAIESADAQRAESEELVAARKTRLDAARAEARAIVDQANKTAATLKEEGRLRGQQEYERLVAAAQADIDGERRRAREEVTRELGRIVVAAAERVIGEELDSDRHRRLIDQTIAEAELGPASDPAGV